MRPEAEAPWAPVPIWALGAGYFAVYVVFALIVRRAQAASIDLFAAAPAMVLGFTLGATPVAWGLYRRYRRIGATAPAHPGRSAVSALATAVIAATTVIALAMDGVGVLLALVLMRGGVLALSPAIDWTHGRRPRGASWAALALSLAAVGLALLPYWQAPALAGLVLLNLAFYWTAYAVRLTAMTRGAKRPEPGLRARWLALDCAGAILALAAALAVAALFDASLRAGVLALATGGPAVQAGLAIGLAYAAVLTFGSLVYLDRRENCFAVTVNRGASLLSGLAAALILHAVFAAPAPAATTYSGALLVVLALAVLARRADDETASAIRPKTAFSVSSTPKA